MNKTAVIDIGSNSVRLMLVADGKVLYKTLNTTRLGEGIASSPFLKDEAISRTASAVADFFSRAKREGAVDVYAFATAAVRSAENGSAFIDRVKELCELDVEIISGEEEAEIGILGALGEKERQHRRRSLKRSVRCGKRPIESRRGGRGKGIRKSSQWDFYVRHRRDCHDARGAYARYAGLHPVKNYGYGYRPRTDAGARGQTDGNDGGGNRAPSGRAAETGGCFGRRSRPVFSDYGQAELSRNYCQRQRQFGRICEKTRPDVKAEEL